MNETIESFDREQVINYKRIILSNNTSLPIDKPIELPNLFDKNVNTIVKRYKDILKFEENIEKKKNKLNMIKKIQGKSSFINQTIKKSKVKEIYKRGAIFMQKNQKKSDHENMIKNLVKINTYYNSKKPTKRNSSVIQEKSDNEEGGRFSLLKKIFFNQENISKNSMKPPKPLKKPIVLDDLEVITTIESKNKSYLETYNQLTNKHQRGEMNELEYQRKRNFNDVVDYLLINSQIYDKFTPVDKYIKLKNECDGNLKNKTFLKFMNPKEKHITSIISKSKSDYNKQLSLLKKLGKNNEFNELVNQVDKTLKKNSNESPAGKKESINKRSLLITELIDTKNDENQSEIIEEKIEINKKNQDVKIQSNKQDLGFLKYDKKEIKNPTFKKVENFKLNPNQTKSKKSDVTNLEFLPDVNDIKQNELGKKLFNCVINTNKDLIEKNSILPSLSFQQEMRAFIKNKLRFMERNGILNKDQQDLNTISHKSPKEKILSFKENSPELNNRINLQEYQAKLLSKSMEFDKNNLEKSLEKKNLSLKRLKNETGIIITKYDENRDFLNYKYAKESSKSNTIQKLSPLNVLKYSKLISEKFKYNAQNNYLIAKRKYIDIDDFRNLQPVVVSKKNKTNIYYSDVLKNLDNTVLDYNKRIYKANLDYIFDYSKKDLVYNNLETTNIKKNQLINRVNNFLKN